MKNIFYPVLFSAFVKPTIAISVSPKPNHDI